MATHAYRGKAVVFPVPVTQRDKLDMCLTMNFEAEESYREQPRLALRDSVSVDFENKPGFAASTNTWKDKVVSPLPSTSLGRVCIAAKQPWKSDQGPLDVNRYTTLSVGDLELMTPIDAQQWARKNVLRSISVQKSSPTSIALLDHFLRHLRQQGPGITDKRILDPGMTRAALHV